MGSFGSGRTARQNRETVENCRALDMNRLNRAGCLRSGWAGTWQWTQEGEEVARIGLRAEEGRVHLSYRYRVGGSEWQDVEETVWLMWQPCRFGGQRNRWAEPGDLNRCSFRSRHRTGTCELSARLLARLRRV